ncbi:YqaA family protein [Methanothermococcus sp. Ax23]|uniref:YqaA family protein n=1 Tax=Methanothermococcus sp. Ax23 TaxID=3156486 RepID=UPI003B9DC9BA
MINFEIFKTIGFKLVNEYGILGIFLIGFSEPIFQPLPTEIFMIAGIALGLDWKYVLLAGAFGTIAGSIITYYLASKYGEKLALKLFSEEDYRKGENFFKKYGVIGFIVISFTPLPFEIMCWVCGAFEMPFKRYIFAVFLSRIIKHGLIILPFALWGSTNMSDIFKYILSYIHL